MLLQRIYISFNLFKFCFLLTSFVKLESQSRNTPKDTFMSDRGGLRGSTWLGDWVTVWGTGGGENIN